MSINIKKTLVYVLENFITEKIAYLKLMVVFVMMVSIKAFDPHLMHWCRVNGLDLCTIPHEQTSLSVCSSNTIVLPIYNTIDTIVKYLKV